MQRTDCPLTLHTSASTKPMFVKYTDMRWELARCCPETAYCPSPPFRSKKGGPYSITERRVTELIPVLGSPRAGDVSHKPGGRLPFLSARPAVTPAALKRADSNFAAW